LPFNAALCQMNNTAFQNKIRDLFVMERTATPM